MTLRIATPLVAGLLVFGLAACDTKPPAFTVRPHASFEVGTQLDFADPDPEYDGYFDFHHVTRHLHWDAVDDGDCAVRYDVIEHYVGDEPRVILEGSTATQLVVRDTDYTEVWGAPDDYPTGWEVTARDCAGNAVTAEVLPDEWQEGPTIRQESGHAAFVGPNGDTVTTAGWWQQSLGPWASGGKAAFTSEPGASITFASDFVEGEHVGLVMANGPGRGSADVYIDDVKVATIDTYAPANDNRRIVFDRLMTPGRHTVKVVNLATAGHPRIDVDAFLAS